MLIVDPQICIPSDELSFTYSRSGGPSGQNVNKRNTQVLPRWSPIRSKALPEKVRQRLLTKCAWRINTEGRIADREPAVSCDGAKHSGLSGKAQNDGRRSGYTCPNPTSHPTSSHRHRRAPCRKTPLLAEKAVSPPEKRRSLGP